MQDFELEEGTRPVFDSIDSEPEQIGEAYVVTANLVDDIGIRQFYMEVEKSVVYGGEESFGVSWPTTQDQEEYLSMALRNGGSPETAVMCQGRSEGEYYSTEESLGVLLEAGSVEVEEIGEVPVHELNGVFVKTQQPLSWDRMEHPDDFGRDETREVGVHMEDVEQLKVLEHVYESGDGLDRELVEQALNAAVKQARAHGFDWNTPPESDL
jgi:hypothetical protein